MILFAHLISSNNSVPF